MEGYQLLLLLFLHLLILFKPNHSARAKQRLGLEWKTFTCLGNPRIVESHNCYILDSDKSLITAEVKYLEDFDRFNATFRLSMPRPPFNEYHKLIDVTFDVCQFFKGSHRHKFIAITYKSMAKHSNMPMKCPQLKGFYFFRNISIGENLPAFLPETDFKIEFNFFTPTSTVFNTTLTGRLSEGVRKG
ncbi:LOW QUALITY PROTEIN: uncharacterized protein [Drosophila tropicalis]|uniref:LOW QUALITY PROTEIN: uncharacterized protein n=1 Tax=Drosophila tropicalis TaxID=46794 RepID=UPI0035AC0B60